MPRPQQPDKVRSPDDLDRNPRIGASKGTTMAGADPDEIEGENAFEGDVENDVRPNGGVDPDRRANLKH